LIHVFDDLVSLGLCVDANSVPTLCVDFRVTKVTLGNIKHAGLAPAASGIVVFNNSLASLFVSLVT
jgi:hypothetical protein